MVKPLSSPDAFNFREGCPGREPSSGALSVFLGA